MSGCITSVAVVAAIVVLAVAEAVFDPEGAAGSALTFAGALAVVVLLGLLLNRIFGPDRLD